MNGFEKRREQKREAIRTAALELYMRHGVRSVGIATIAEAAGVSQVTIYNYFGSKDELTRDVVTRYLEQYVKDFEAFCQDELPYAEKMEQLLHRTSTLDALHIEFIDTFLSDAPELAEVINNYEAKLVPLFVAFIEEGKLLGYFNSQLSTEMILFYINLFNSQAIMKLKEIEDDRRRRQMYKELWIIFFNGVVSLEYKQNASV